MADDFNKPNITIPLGFSYDQRGQDSRALIANPYTSGTDQRKINAYYQVYKNAVTGNSTVELCKRPGVRTSGKTGGSSGYTQYLVCNVTGSESSGSWVASSNGSTVSVTNSGGTISSALIPVYLDKTIISGTPTAVLQLRNPNAALPPPMTAYYSTGSGWTQISASAYTGISHVGKMEHLDGFAFQLGYDNNVYNSDLNSVSAWTSGNFLAKQIQQDRSHGLALFKDKILAFGSETVEFFRNVGNPSGSPLISVPELSEKIGMGLLADPNQVTSVGGTTSYYATVGGVMYFVGRRGGPALLNLGVFAYNGREFGKVSNSAIDRIISDTGSGYIYSITPFTFYGNNAVAIQLTAPGTTTQRWLMYFPDHGEWFEWVSDVFSPVNDGRVFLGSVVGDTNTYWFLNASFDDTWQDAGTAYNMLVQFRLPSGGNNRKFMRWCALEADTTSAASNVAVSFSDNDYQSFTSAGNIDLSSQEKRLMRNGSYKNRVVMLDHGSNYECRIRKFMARVE